jgi:hypothetical protein
MRQLPQILALASALLAAGPVLAAKHSAASTQAIPTQPAATAFAEVQALCQADAWALWGRSLCVPMMFVDPATHQVVLNGVATGATQDGTLYRITLPSDMALANTSVQYDGKAWSMVMWPLPADTTHRHILLMHESFHSIQGALGLMGSGGLGKNGHLDTRSGRLWLRAEFAALRTALTSSGDARNQALSDALMFRAYRHSLATHAATDERSLELNEGLAESTGVDAALTDPAARIKAALDDIETVEKEPSYVRSFAYATGPAYAELLDAATPGWRQQVHQGFDFANTTAAAYHIIARQPDAAMAAAGLARYDGVKLVAEEDKRDKKVQADNARFTAALVTGPTLTVPLGKFSISFDPRMVHELQYRGSVYENLEIQGEWGALKVVSGLALIPSSFDKVTLPLKGKLASPHLKGPGWTLELKPGYTLQPKPGKVDSWQLVADAPKPAAH